MASKIISVLSKKYGFDADEALAFYNESGSTTSITTVQRAENAIAKTQTDIDELKAKIPEKKGKLLTNAQAKLAKLEDKLAEQNKKLEVKQAKAEKADKPKAEPKPKSDKPKSEPKAKEEKRIARMSPTLTKDLKKIFEDGKKPFDKENGSAFAKYANEMSEADFGAKNLADHMRDYAATIGAPAPPPEPEMPPLEPSNDNEDMTEITWRGKAYVVGDASKRVYEADEENGDRFVGYVGTGKFKDLKFPA